MPRFGNMLIAYFVIGAVMMGGGVVSYEEAGMPTFFVDDPSSQSVSPSGEAQDNTQGIGEEIPSVLDALAGPIVIIWQLIKSVITFMNWPILTLASNNAPPMATVLLGGTLTAGFYVGIIRIMRSSV